MLLYLARATQVMDLEIDSPHAYLGNTGTLHASLENAKTALSIALMHEARKWIASAATELDIIWDEPTTARCVVRSFDANGNKGLWMKLHWKDKGDAGTLKAAAVLVAQRPTFILPQQFVVGGGHGSSGSDLQCDLWFKALGMGQQN